MTAIKWVVAIAAIVIVALIIVGAGMYFRLIPIPGPILALLVGAKPPEYSARYYPPDTLAYAWLTLVPGQGQFNDMQDIWQRFNEYPAFRDLVDELQEEFEADTGINFEEDVLPWAGPEISVGLLDFKSGIEEPIIVGMIAVREQDAADDFLVKWLEYMEDSEGADFDTGSYLGIDIVIEEDSEAAYALTKDWLVFATGESALELALDRIAGEKDDSLASNEIFKSARAALPERRFASGYLDYKRSSDLWEYLDPIGFGVVGTTALGTQEPEWLASSTAWVEKGVTMEIVIPIGIDYPLIVADLSDPADLLPNDTLAFVAGTFDTDVDHWRKVLDEYPVADVLTAEMIDEINQGIDEFYYDVDILNLPDLEADSTLADVLDFVLEIVAVLIDIDLEEDLFDHLAGEMVIAVRDFSFAAIEEDPANTPVEVATMLSYREDGKEGLEDTMNQLSTLLQTYTGVNARPIDLGGEEDALVFSLDPVMGETAYAPGYVLHEGYITASSTVETLTTIVGLQNNAGSPLSSNAEYLRAAEHLPGARQFLGYVNIHRIIAQLDSGDLDIDHDEYRILDEGLGVIAVSSYSPHCLDIADGGNCEIPAGQDGSRLTAVLTLFPE